MTMTPEIEKLFNEAKPLSEIDQEALAKCIEEALKPDLPSVTGSKSITLNGKDYERRIRM